MPLILVRHAKAISRRKAILRNIPDIERSLTDKGRESFIRHVYENLDLFVETDLFVTSPYVRAKQTLELLISSLQVKIAPVEVLPNITPDDATDSLVNWLQDRDHRKIVIVSHEPFISNFLIQATAGRWSPQKIRKGDFVIVTQKGRGLKVEIVGIEKN